nr:MAG TPA: LYSOSOMAL ALPHA-MANNOSIDASE [Caudoviricetes sp.]
MISSRVTTDHNRIGCDGPYGVVLATAEPD